MKKEILKILLLIKNNWRIIAEFLVVVWAIRGMYLTATFKWKMLPFFKSETTRDLASALLGKGINLPLILLTFYFLSAILILYFLRDKRKK